MRRRDIKIALIRDLNSDISRPFAMNLIRWYKIGVALKKIGYEVNFITSNRNYLLFKDSNEMQVVHPKDVEWANYDVIKADLHSGFEAYLQSGGGRHPFIITKLGSAVWSHDAEGVYFYGGEREKIYSIQNEVMKYSRYVTTLTDANEMVLHKEYPSFERFLRVPTGVDKELPSLLKNPYPKTGQKICIYAGNLYGGKKQLEVNRIWQDRLNAIGKELRKKGVQLFFIGPGDTQYLDQEFVKNIGSIQNDEIWTYQHFADVGLALAHGEVCDNESSKIYYYLRSGLPVVAEQSLPNSFLVETLGLGLVVPYGDIDAISGAVEKWAYLGKKDNCSAMRVMAEQHSWDARAAIYDRVLVKEFDLSGN